MSGISALCLKNVVPLLCIVPPNINAVKLLNGHAGVTKIDKSTVTAELIVFNLSKTRVYSLMDMVMSRARETENKGTGTKIN